MSDTPEFRDLMLVENPGFDDVMRCVFGLQAQDVEAYLALREHEEASAAALADDLDRDRTTVSRTLATLREKGVVTRHRRLLDGGGHVYCYTSKPLDAVKARMHEELDAWTASVHDRIDDFAAPRDA